MSLSRITASVIFLTGLAALLHYLFARKQAELCQHVGGNRRSLKFLHRASDKNYVTGRKGRLCKQTGESAHIGWEFFSALPCQ
jgi:hypothetical protein